MQQLWNSSIEKYVRRETGKLTCDAVEHVKEYIKNLPNGSCPTCRANDWFVHPYLGSIPPYFGFSNKCGVLPVVVISCRACQGIRTFVGPPPLT